MSESCKKRGWQTQPCTACKYLEVLIEDRRYHDERGFRLGGACLS